MHDAVLLELGRKNMTASLRSIFHAWLLIDPRGSHPCPCRRINGLLGLERQVQVNYQTGFKQSSRLKLRHHCGIPKVLKLQSVCPEHWKSSAKSCNPTAAGAVVYGSIQYHDLKPGGDCCGHTFSPNSWGSNSSSGQSLSMPALPPRAASLRRVDAVETSHQWKQTKLSYPNYIVDGYWPPSHTSALWTISWTIWETLITNSTQFRLSIYEAHQLFNAGLHPLLESQAHCVAVDHDSTQASYAVLVSSVWCGTVAGASKDTGLSVLPRFKSDGPYGPWTLW